MRNYNTFQEEIIMSIYKKVKDKSLRFSLEKYFRSDKFKKNPLPKKVSDYKQCIYNFINIMRNKKYQDLGWEFMCNSIDKYASKDLEYTLSHIRYFIESYFLYLLENEYMNTERLLLFKKYEHLVKEGFYAKIKKTSILETFQIHTQYPKNSKVEYMYQYTFIDNTHSGIVNINLNTDNQFIHKLLSLFIKQLGKENTGKPTMISYKIFYYYFEDSFSPKAVPINEFYFNEESFKIQYGFYKRKEKMLKNIKMATSLCRVLINFYIFLIYHLDELGIDHNIFRKNNWNTHLLLNSNFSYNYENGYIYTIYNPLENCPDYDRWWLDTRQQSISSVSMNNLEYNTIDFTEVYNEIYRKDLKSWLWNNNALIKNQALRVPEIIEFLKFKEEYDNGKVTQLNQIDTGPFSFDMMWFFLVYLDENYENMHTKRSITNCIRSYLKLYKEKYNISQKTLDLLKLEYCEGEGSPISKKDMELILSEFKCLKDTQKDGLLLYYIFILCITTNLRPGEILNLERNCIIYQDIKGNGTIRLRRKTSKGEYFEREYNAETIQIIKTATNLTEKFVSIADEQFKNFIFITCSAKNNKDVRRLSGEFNRSFYNIVRKLSHNIDKLYIPYNLRHTFINAVYDDGIANNVSIEKLQSITDNNYNTVMKHYRKKLELRDYVEVMSKVIISNVDIEGNVLVNEEEIINGHPVMDNLGGCSEDDCINEKTSLCLICNHFFTCLSRITVFEERTRYFREKLNNRSLSDSIKIEYETYLKLYATYLAKMLDMQKDLRR